MENDNQYKSKTQSKKEADELQKLGEKLAQLSDQQLEQLNLPDDLKTALIEARSIKSNVAARRQRQFIGALMRDVDSEPIRNALPMIDAEPAVKPEADKEAGMWLEKFSTGESSAVEEFVLACPGSDRQKLRQLQRNLKKKQTPKKSSKAVKALSKLILDNLKNR